MTLRALKSLVIIAFAIAFVGCMPAQSAKTSSSAILQDKTLTQARKLFGDAMSKKNSVLLYFHSATVKDSRKDLPKLKEIAAAADAEVVEIEAMDLDALRDSYSVEYVPTVYAIRRDSGVVGRWMVDLPAKEIEAALSKNLKPSGPEQAAIGKAISSKKPQLLFFMAQWCGYCRKIAPQVEKFKKDYASKVEVVEIDIDRIPYRMKEGYMINGVPAIFIADHNGLLVKRTGYPDGYKDYENYFKSIGGDVSGKTAPAKPAATPAKPGTTPNKKAPAKPKTPATPGAKPSGNKT